MLRLFVKVCRSRVSSALLLVLTGALSLTASTRPIFTSQSGNESGSSSSAPKPTFLVSPSVKVTGLPSAVAAVDLNSDGFRDLVAANAQSGTVDVLLGDGRGRFQAQVCYKVGKDPIGILVDDFNNDGNMDIAVANRGSNSISVLLGNGDGTLQPATTYGVGSSPVAVIALQSTNRGNLDLAVANEGGNSVSILLNKGDGTFHTGATYNVSSPHTISAGDFDNDGNADLAVGSPDGTVTILLGRGDGSMQPAGGFKAEVATLSAVVAADFNHDGKLDLAIADSASNRISVMLGTGAANFQATTGNDVGNEPVFLAAQDLNGDGNPDLVAVNRSGNTVSVLLSRGDGTFEPARDFVVGKSPVSVAIGDFNGDGHADLAAANSDETISTPLGNGDGTFKAAEDYRTQLERKAVAVGDLNGDSRPDLIVANYCGSEPRCSSDGSASIFLNTGTGSLHLAYNLALGKGPMAIALADLNGDKKLDLIAANRDENTLMVFLGNGDGSFQAPLSYSLAGSPVALAAADFNRDGKIDVAVATQCGSARCSQPGVLNILLGNGDGSFKAGPSLQVGFSPVSIVAADLNRDHTPDLAVVNACGTTAACTSGTALLLIGDGKGGFKQGSEIALGRQPSALAVADLNRDGQPDLVVTNSSDNQAAVLIGNADGSFGKPVLYRVGSTPSAVAVADFDGDGKLDVAVSSFKNSTVDVLLGFGDGILQAPVSYAVGAGPEALAAILLTDKGSASLVSANGNTGGAPAGNDITVLANAGVAPTAGQILSIAKTHSGNFTRGQTGATYSITVSNTGTGATSGTVTVTDTLPTGLTATAIDGGINWTCVLNTLSCNRADALPPGNSFETITLTVDVANNAPASVTNSVTVSGGGAPDDTATDPTTIVFPVLKIAKTHIGNFTRGQTGATYSIDVKNTGTAPTSGTVTVTDTLPTGLTATAIGGGPNWTCVLNALKCTRADALPAGNSYETITLTVDVANNAPASVTNSVTVSGGSSANDTANDPTTIVFPVLKIAKTHVGNFTQGDIGDKYSLVVNNTGTAPTSGTVTVTDTLPTGLTATAVTGTNWTCVLNTLKCTRADALPVGNSYETITLTVDVAADSPTNITNSATVSGGNSASDTANDPTVVIQVPASITPTGGTPQSTAVTTPFATKFAATVKDAGGQPVPNKTVAFAVAPGASGQTCTFTNGTGNDTGVTNASGVATPQHWPCTANTVASQTAYKASATVVPVATSADFSLTNLPGPPASIAPDPGTTPQKTVINNTFTTNLSATVKDQFGNLVLAGVSVDFTPSADVNTGACGTFAGAGHCSRKTATTNGSGDVQAPALTADSTNGTWTVIASANGVSSLPFTLTNQDYTIAAAAPDLGAIVQSQSTSDLITLTSLPHTASGYSGTVNLSCTVASITQPAIGSTPTCSLVDPNTNTLLTSVVVPANGTIAVKAVIVTAVGTNPIGAFMTTVTGTDLSTFPDTHSTSFIFSVVCQFEAQNPKFTLDSANNNSPVYQFDVAEMNGGNNCPWNGRTSGSVAFTAASPTSGTLTAVGNSQTVMYTITASQLPETGDVTFGSVVGTPAAPFGPQFDFMVSHEAAISAPAVVAGNTSINPKVPVTLSGAAMQLLGADATPVCTALRGGTTTDPNNFNITCTPTSVDPLTGTFSFQITTSISTQASIRRDLESNGGLPFSALALGLPAMIFLPLLPAAFAGRRGRSVSWRVGSVFVILLLISLIILLPSCGGGINADIQPPGTKGTYTLRSMGAVTDGTGAVVGVETYEFSITVLPKL